MGLTAPGVHCLSARPRATTHRRSLASALRVGHQVDSGSDGRAPGHRPGLGRPRLRRCRGPGTPLWTRRRPGDRPLRFGTRGRRRSLDGQVRTILCSLRGGLGSARSALTTTGIVKVRPVGRHAGPMPLWAHGCALRDAWSLEVQRGHIGHFRTMGGTRQTTDSARAEVSDALADGRRRLGGGSARCGGPHAVLALQEMRRDEPAIDTVEKGLTAAKAADVPVDREGRKPPASALAVTTTGFGPRSVAAKKPVSTVNPLGKAAAVAAKAGGSGKAVAV